MSSNTDNGRAINAKGLATAAVALTALMAFLFWDSFRAGQVQFANDGPLGVLASKAMAMPQILKGLWMDLYWLGMNGKYANISLTYALDWLLGPVGFAKFYDPICQVILDRMGVGTADDGALERVEDVMQSGPAIRAGAPGVLRGAVGFGPATALLIQWLNLDNAKMAHFAKILCPPFPIAPLAGAESAVSLRFKL